VSGSCGWRRTGWGPPGGGSASRASRTRSTRSRSPGRWSRTAWSASPPPIWIGPRSRSACCPITARTSSPSAPAPRTGCAGTCSSSAPSSSARSAAARSRIRGSSRGSIDGCVGCPPAPASRIAREQIAQLRDLTRRVDALERELLVLITAHRPQLLAETGCGALTAALLIGRTAGAQRFPSDASFARQTGTAPIPCSSGQRHRHRLDRGGDRQLNHALHIIAITRARHDPATKAYLARKEAEGKGKKGALRCLKRHLARRFHYLLSLPAEPSQRDPKNGAVHNAAPRPGDTRILAAAPALMPRIS
jgi:hypothetical protein